MPKVAVYSPSASWASRVKHCS